MAKSFYALNSHILGNKTKESHNLSVGSNFGFPVSVSHLFCEYPTILKQRPSGINSIVVNIFFVFSHICLTIAESQQTTILVPNSALLPVFTYLQPKNGYYNLKM